MRLICPNCDAQYKVADDAIPEGGRDVQCSSCAHTWYQTEKPVVAGRDPSTILTDPMPTPEAEKDKAEEKPDDASATPKEDDAPKRKPLDVNVAEILRSEAARENNVKKSPTPAPPPTQAEVRTETVDADETRKRIAQMTVEEGGTSTGMAQAATAAAAGTEPNLRSIPDINEINAALRARAQANDTSGLNETEKNEAVRRKGFRRGFFIMLLLIAILIAPYFFADQITEALPQTQSFMANYVLTVDQLRVWLDGQVGNIREMIQGS